MLARERCDDAGGGLQVAPLVLAHLACINVVGERAPELRRVGRSRQILQVVVGKDLVFLRPLTIVDVLFQVVVDIPLRRVAARVGPDAAVEYELHRQALVDRVLQ